MPRRHRRTVCRLPARGGDFAINLSNAAGDYNLAWYNPRTGEAELSAQTVSGDAIISIKAMDEPEEDWAIVLRRIQQSTTPPNP